MYLYQGITHYIIFFTLLEKKERSLHKTKQKTLDFIRNICKQKLQRQEQEQQKKTHIFKHWVIFIYLIIYLTTKNKTTTGNINLRVARWASNSRRLFCASADWNLYFGRETTPPPRRPHSNS